MTRACIFIPLQLLYVCLFAQNVDQEVLVERAMYDSAKAEFLRFEREHGHFIQTQNTNLHYLEWGNPSHLPLIWLHGSFTNSYELKDIVEELVKQEYYVIAIDHYGHGLTQIPNHEVSLYHVADDVSDLMEEKNISKAVIGGWSRGGIIATAFYDAYPEKVLGLILEDGGSVSTNTYYHKMEEEELTTRVDEIFKERMDIPTFDSEFEAYQYFYSQEEGGTQFPLLAWIQEDSTGKWSIGAGLEDLFHMASKKQFLETVLRPTKASMYGESMALIEPKIIYRNLSVPMLILDPVSDNDLFPFERENSLLQQAHPTLVRYMIYKDTGHNIHYEQPDRFTRDLIEFKSVIETFWTK
ncbi:MAG: alpha/beta hydrolase [Bacteroidota bacterium]